MVSKSYPDDIFRDCSHMHTHKKSVMAKHKYDFLLDIAYLLDWNFQQKMQQKKKWKRTSTNKTLLNAYVVDGKCGRASNVCWSIVMSLTLLTLWVKSWFTHATNRNIHMRDMRYVILNCLFLALVSIINIRKYTKDKLLHMNICHLSNISLFYFHSDTFDWLYHIKVQLNSLLRIIYIQIHCQWVESPTAHADIWRLFYLIFYLGYSDTFFFIVQSQGFIFY